MGRHQPQKRNARFKVSVLGRFEAGGEARDYVVLTLRPGQVVHHHQSWPTDEGYGYRAAEYYYDGEQLHRECASGGRDCDGRIDYFNTSVATPPAPDSDRWPEWRVTERSQRDHQAEAAGY